MKAPPKDDFPVSLTTYGAIFITIFAINLLTSGLSKFTREKELGIKDFKLTKILIDLVGLLLTVILVVVGVVSQRRCEVRKGMCLAGYSTVIVYYLLHVFLVP